MCGIFGYVGTQSAPSILLGGLEALEYRGYDSAGMYIAGYGTLKSVGKVAELANLLNTHTPDGVAGIAHTRWATHGEPTEINAHPHTDMTERIWLVHNGIIENWRQIKDGLVVQGITFTSETDTEVLTKLIGSLYTGNLKEAVQQALQIVEGTYGIAVMSERKHDEIIVARMGSPIVLGVGTDAHFVSSDPSALLAHTKDVVYLDDGDIAVVHGTSYDIISTTGKKKVIAPERIEWDAVAVQKNGYEHFMLKEIFEAPEVIENTIRGRLIPHEGKAKLGGLEPVLDTLTELQRLVIVGCGSAYFAGQVGRLMLEEYANLACEVELGSEYRYKRNLPVAKSAVLAVSQSGETADTLASIKAAKRLGLPTYGIVNAVGSTIARTTDAGVYNHAGPEIAVASTKAFISQLTVFVLLTLLVGREQGMTKETGRDIAAGLASLPATLAQMLEHTKDIQRIAEAYAHHSNMMYIGRTFHAPIAAEGALKLKEVSYIHAEAYAGGELKHGSIALLGPDFPVVAIAPHDSVYTKVLSNIEEVRARKAPVIMIATEGDLDAERLADEVIYIPRVHPILQPIVSTVPLQLLAYYTGVAKGINVDQPRNLAKSVTVE